jgi:hypothetical protein
MPDPGDGAQVVPGSLADIAGPPATGAGWGNLVAMIGRTHRPFPGVAVRDALGLVRLLWVLESTGTDLDRMKALTEIGETLRDTLRQGRLDPECIGYSAGIRRAEHAVDRLVRLGWSADRADLVRLAADRVCGRRRAPRAEAPRREAAG